MDHQTPNIFAPFVSSTAFWLIVFIGLSVSLAFWQLILDFIHPPTGKKFRAAVKSCFPSDDDNKGSRS